MAAIPKIHLLCFKPEYQTAFEAARKKHELPDSVQIEFHEGALSQLSSTVSFDLVVSPANSYGRLDGGFDDAISRAFSPLSDYLALTRIAQAKLYQEWCGFAPPGTCTLVPFHFDEPTRNVWGCKYVALCPTMRFPQYVTWDKEVVYECVWSLLCALSKHNRSSSEEGSKIDRILMTPLGTGVGGITAEKWAAQAVLALKHFVDASENQEKWSNLNFQQIYEYFDQVKATHDM